MPEDVVQHIALQPQEVGSVDRGTSVPRVVDAAVLLVRLADVADHVPMNGIPPQPESLPSVLDLEVRQPCRQRLVTRTMQEYLAPELIARKLRDA
eukprot:CAMPEP_0177700862 /NCGR_PEP_ID=MMETSP0484_2-20121128/6314_1 /TAXON_ID=354590 /ORGANISM="Rhodomonas lens, Strain RHODO" /LENGTH=94 /DNA_ID=CAMNT_0019212077 /DNA_START=844 /DNA_END=1125 /DNA_ORIENTATION=-